MVIIAETGLERERTSRIYRHRLRQGWDIFVAWANRNSINLDRLSGSAPTAADQVLADFLNSCRDQQVPLWLARHALLSVQTHHRQLKGKIPRAWDCLRSWQAQKAWGNRVPIDLTVLKVLFAVSLDWAFTDGFMARLLFPFAVLIRVGFYGFLRPAKICRLRAGDVKLPTSDTPSPTAVLGLSNPKTRNHNGRAQFSLISDNDTVQWLTWLKHSLPPAVKLWPSTPEAFRSVFKAVLGRSKLSLPLTPGCLRAGGATYLVTSGLDLGRIKFLGRWSSERTLSCYVQEAVAQLAWLQLDSDSQRKAQLIVEQSSAAWSSAPALPWCSLFSRGKQWRTLRLSHPTHLTGSTPAR